jgi:hypothetical protein
MAYKTNSRALRLGLSHNWTFAAHGPSHRLHLDEKLHRYVANLVEWVTPQAPQGQKTKGRQQRKVSQSPGILGRSLVLRSGGRLQLVAFYYLNLGGADGAQLAALSGNFGRLVQLLQRESGYEVGIMALNYYYYFWRLRLFSGRYRRRSVRRQLQAMALQHRFSRFERVALSVHSHRIRSTRRALRRYRRERYFSRTFRPLVAAFMAEDFDADLVAKAVALELQILRVHHRRFLRYLRNFLALGFRHWNHHRRLEGLRLEIRGRLTQQRRQGRRTTVTNLRYGSFRKADLRREASHCRYVAYNRFGAIGVALSYQLRPVVAEQWEDRVAQSPLRAYSLRETLETLGERRDGRLDPALGLGHPSYQQWPGAVADAHPLLEAHWAPGPARRALGALEAAAAEGRPAAAAADLQTLASRQPPLEVLNRLCYYRRRLALHRRAADRAFRRPLLLLRPRRSTLAKGYTQSHRFPLRRAALAPFQLLLRRAAVQTERLRAGTASPRRSAAVPPTDRQRRGLRGGSGFRPDGRQPLPGGRHWPAAPEVRRSGPGRRPRHHPQTHPAAAPLPLLARRRGGPANPAAANPANPTSTTGPTHTPYPRPLRLWWPSSTAPAAADGCGAIDPLRWASGCGGPCPAAAPAASTRCATATWAGGG